MWNVLSKWTDLLTRFNALKGNVPETGELNGQGLRLTLLPDHHFIQEPAAASTPTIVADPHPAHPTQGHGLDEELIMLIGRQRHNFY